MILGGASLCNLNERYKASINHCVLLCGRFIVFLRNLAFVACILVSTASCTIVSPSKNLIRHGLAPIGYSEEICDNLIDDNQDGLLDWRRCRAG